MVKLGTLILQCNDTAIALGRSGSLSATNAGSHTMSTSPARKGLLDCFLCSELQSGGKADHVAGSRARHVFRPALKKAKVKKDDFLRQRKPLKKKEVVSFSQHPAVP